METREGTVDREGKGKKGKEGIQHPDLVVNFNGKKKNLV